jgi:hypothetical protein
MKAPERTTADAFPAYVGCQVIADSATLKWPGLFVRRYRFPRVVDGFLETRLRYRPPTHDSHR